MRQVHEGRGITMHHFAMVAAHLADSLCAAGVPPETITEILCAIAPLAPDIRIGPKKKGHRLKGKKHYANRRRIARTPMRKCDSASVRDDDAIAAYHAQHGSHIRRFGGRG